MFGKKLLEFRARHNLTQKQAAKIIGVGTTMIHRYEKGLANPSAMREIRFNAKMEKWEVEQC